MPTKHFALKPGEPKRLEISWEPVWKNLYVRLDNRALGRFLNMQELQQGRDFALEDGSKLTVRLELQMPMNTPYLHVLHNGRPLAGSDSDPRKQFGDSFTFFMVIAAIYAIGGLASMLNLSDLPASLGLGASALPIGLVLLAIGGWAIQTGSRVAVGIALAAGLAEALWFFLVNPAAGGQGFLLAAVLRLALVVMPISALKDLAEAARSGR